MGPTKLAKMHSDFAEKVRGPASAKASAGKQKVDTVTQTKELLEQGLNVKEIAKKRGLTPGTILDHVQKIKEDDPSFNIYHLQHHLPKTKFRQIYSAFRKIGMGEGGVYHLAPVKNLLGPKYSYDDLRLVRLFL